jgi:integrase
MRNCYSRCSSKITSPGVWVASPENRDLRQLLWHRHRLVQMRTRIISVLIALSTGMRKGEIYGLRWEQVNLAARYIHVQNGKTNESDRRIPMNESVQELLSELGKVRKGDFVFPSPRNRGERFRDQKV